MTLGHEARRTVYPSLSRWLLYICCGVAAPAALAELIYAGRFAERASFRTLVAQLVVRHVVKLRLVIQCVGPFQITIQQLPCLSRCKGGAIQLNLFTRVAVIGAKAERHLFHQKKYR